MWKERPRKGGRPGDGATLRLNMSGNVAHVVCLEGKPYDERQMTMMEEED